MATSLVHISVATAILVWFFYCLKASENLRGKWTWKHSEFLAGTRVFVLINKARIYFHSIGYFQPPSWIRSNLSMRRYETRKFLTWADKSCNYSNISQNFSFLRSTKWNRLYPRQKWLPSQKAPSKQSNFINMLFNLSKSFSKKLVPHQIVIIAHLLPSHLCFQCRPEYKIPGLYVIDSIVRQSRHQFGPDKDVFAPRFSKNVTYTFYFIYQCTAEEKVI